MVVGDHLKNRDIDLSDTQLQTELHFSSCLRMGDHWFGHWAASHSSTVLIFHWDNTWFIVHISGIGKLIWCTLYMKCIALHGQSLLRQEKNGSKHWGVHHCYTVDARQPRGQRGIYSHSKDKRCEVVLTGEKRSEELAISRHFVHSRQLGAVSFLLSEHSKLQHLGQKLQEKALSSFFRSGTPPPLCLPR